MPWCVTSPDSCAWRKRRSIGSMPSASASSSICCSTANVACGFPKPRTEPPYALFVYATAHRMRMFGTRYMELTVCIATSMACEPQALYAPLSETMSAWRKSRFPSASAPVRSRMWIGWRVRVPVNSSSRLITSFTGLRAALGQEHADEVVGVDVDLAAEAPTHRGLADRDLAPVEAERVGELLAVHEHHVDRAPHGQMPGRVERRDQDVGLDGCRCRERARVLALDDHVRHPCRRVDVAVVEVPPHRDIAANVRPLAVDDRGTVVERLEGVEHGGEDLVLDPDGVQCCSGGRLVGGRHRRDLVADATNGVGLQRQVVAVEAEGALLDSAGVDDGLDAGHLLRGTRVDPDDASVRVRAAQDRRVQQSRQAEVVGVLRRASDLLGRVELRDAPPHDRERCGSLRCGEWDRHGARGRARIGARRGAAYVTTLTITRISMQRTSPIRGRRMQGDDGCREDCSTPCSCRAVSLSTARRRGIR